MTGHHLIAGDSGCHCVHNRPLRSGCAPPPLRFLHRQLYRASTPEVNFQTAAIHEYATPDDLAGLADALESSAAEPEIHSRLALSDGADIASDEMVRGHGAGD